jgi:hypothetical protein
VVAVLVAAPRRPFNILDMKRLGRKLVREIYLWGRYHTFLVPVPRLEREVIALARKTAR